MRDLRSARTMKLKALLFFVLALLAAVGLLLESPSVRTAVLVVVLAWAAARLYYFLFYVLQTYVDPRLKYSGLLSLLRELRRAPPDS
ncbi:MAG TPA: hypothetical protein VFR31_00035 [Thermoanaerobaculia bacterium]|nr:hypothetical protein [Thermoanaerobaculia bacterium]